MSTAGNSHSRESAIVDTLTLNPFDYFPLELNKQIFSKLPIAQLLHLRLVSRAWKDHMESICRLLDTLDMIDTYYVGDRKFSRALVLTGNAKKSRLTGDSGRYLAAHFPAVKHFSLYIYSKVPPEVSSKAPKWASLITSLALQLTSLDIDSTDAEHLEPLQSSSGLHFPNLKQFTLRESTSVRWPVSTTKFVHAFLDRMPALERLTTGQLVTNARAIRTLTHLTIRQRYGAVYSCNYWKMMERYTKLTYLNLTGFCEFYTNFNESLQLLPSLQCIVLPVNMYTLALGERSSHLDLSKTVDSVTQLHFQNIRFWLHSPTDKSGYFVDFVLLALVIFPNVRKLTFEGPVYPNTQRETIDHLNETFVSLFTANGRSVETVFLLREF